MNKIFCTFDANAAQILEIFNNAIANSTALYEYQPRTMATMRMWFSAKAAGNFPVIGITNDDGVLLGFASYGTFRAFPAFKYSVEHSVYIHKDHRGIGLGRMLMAEIIAAAKAQQMHVLVGGIDASNESSIALHEKLGFTHAGTILQAGFKFGRWLDLAFYQLQLNTPANPIDG